MDAVIETLRAFFNTYFSWVEASTVTIIRIGPTDVMEIIILSFLVYHVMAWIRATRAWILMKGILIMGVFVSLAFLLRMDTITFLIRQGVDLVLTAAIVIFQPELRRALEQLGEKKIFSAIIPFDASKEVQERFNTRSSVELVKGCVEMGKAKTGALIVIEQNTALTEYERTGIALDSLITSQLLINIFEHNTPLHDGAVLVRGDRIVSATCYLPLSDNMELSKDLGTRHRAGVGISEATDSVTIIVSEETGGISVAYKGRLDRDLDAEALKKWLVMAQDKSVEAKKIKKFRFRKGKGRQMKRLLNNIGMKLASVLIAFLIWLVVVTINDPEQTRAVPNVRVTIRNSDAILNADKAFDVQSGDTTTVYIRGRSSVLDSISSSDITVVADMQYLSNLTDTPSVQLQISVAGGKYSRHRHVVRSSGNAG